MQCGYVTRCFPGFVKFSNCCFGSFVCVRVYVCMCLWLKQIKERINEKIVKGSGSGGFGPGAASGGSVVRAPGTGAGLRVAPQPMLPKLLTTNIDVMDLEPLEIARQMTILDHEVFCRIQPPELLG